MKNFPQYPWTFEPAEASVAGPLPSHLLKDAAGQQFAIIQHRYIIGVPSQDKIAKVVALIASAPDLHAGCVAARALFDRYPVLGEMAGTREVLDNAINFTVPPHLRQWATEKIYFFDDVVANMLPGVDTAKIFESDSYRVCAHTLYALRRGSFAAIIHRDSNGLLIRNKDQESTMQLIAAAPELLEACIEANSLFDNYPEIYVEAETYDKLNDAINRATGNVAAPIPVPSY